MRGLNGRIAVWSSIRPHVRADHPAALQTIPEQKARTGVSSGSQSPLL
jgi:hypothetical protein